MNERTRWWQRVVPVVGLGCLGVAVAAATVPGLAEEIELSTSRQEQSFVELFLTTSADTLCGGEQAHVRFRVQSHLDRPRVLRHAITLDPSRGPTTRRAVKVRVDPGEAHDAAVRIPTPEAGAYTVTVRLRGRPEVVRVHCPGEAS